MKVEDFAFGLDKNNMEYVEFIENPTKTRQSGLTAKPRSFLPKMFATGNERCPVAIFKEFLWCRPQEQSDIFACVLLTSNHMIFLVQFGINKHSYIFQRLQIARARRARAILLALEKFTRAYLFQIVLEIMWLRRHRGKMHCARAVFLLLVNAPL